MRRWTSDEEALLAQLVEEGKSSMAIAARLKRTLGSVERKIYELSLRAAFRVERPKGGMSELTFADYLAGRRSTYTQEWHMLQELRKDAAFRDARSWEDIERYLNDRDAALGIRSCARAAWTAYATARRKAQTQP